MSIPPLADGTPCPLAGDEIGFNAMQAMLRTLDAIPDEQQRLDQFVTVVYASVAHLFDIVQPDSVHAMLSGMISVVQERINSRGFAHITFDLDSSKEDATPLGLH